MSKKMDDAILDIMTLKNDFVLSAIINMAKIEKKIKINKHILLIMWK